MNNSEKIYLGIIGVLCYLLYFKASQKTACPSCKCEPTKTIYVPTVVPTPQTVVNPKILEEALIYTGPSKFEVPDKTDNSKGVIYWVENSKYYKGNYERNNPSYQIVKTEVTIKEIVDAWNSVK